MVANEEALDNIHVVIQDTKEVQALSISITKDNTMIKESMVSSLSKDISQLVFKSPLIIFKTIEEIDAHSIKYNEKNQL